MSDRRRRLRLVLLAVGALAAFVFAWYILGRVTSPLRAAKVISSTNYPRPGQATPGVLKIGTYNIAHGRGLAEGNWAGRDREADLERLRAIGRLLAGQELDVVVLNEVDFGCTWSRGVNQAEVIAREAGFPYRAEGRNLDVQLPFLAFRFGNAVLSRFPIVEARAVDYPAYSRLEALAAGKKRGLLCTLELPGGKRLRVLVVHLEHRSEATRSAAAEVIAHLAADGGAPLIAAGDFNTTPPVYPHAHRDAAGQTAFSRLLESGRFAAAVKDAPGPEDFTFSSDKPRMVIDWILVPAGWKIAGQRALDSRLSDHRAVVAEIRPGDEH
jgi:endonuclease/exonuclease/phosphatase family metal-dependent hydrolase